MAKRKGNKIIEGRKMVDPTNWAKEKYYPSGKPIIKRTKKHTTRKR